MKQTESGSGSFILVIHHIKTTKMNTATKQARLKLNGKRIDDGTFPAMKIRERTMIRQGYDATKLHVGYARANGLYYCKKCGKQVINPASDYYNESEFWKCDTCNQINFINIQS